MPSTSQSTNPQAAGPPGVAASAPSFWRRMTEGLELSQLWAQFRADATSSYRLYSRDFKARPQQTVQRHGVWHTMQDFAWAILEKLTPARRVLLLLAVVLLLFGGGEYSYQGKGGNVTVVTFPVQFYGGAILFVLLMLEVADRVVMKRDLEIARDIQRWLLPATPPQVPGLAIAFATRAANTVAGDYYDVFARSGQRAEGTHFLLAVADVAGKSIPAALLMATFQASLRTLAGASSSLADLVVGMNRYACSNSQGGLRFTTAFLADFNSSDKSLIYINAGHNAPILRRQNGTIERLSRGGLPLGIQSDEHYDSGSVNLQPGDWLIVFTDGLVEALNLREEEYGEARLLDVLNTSADVLPDELLRRIMASVDAFVGATPQHDDITSMLVRVV